MHLHNRHLTEMILSRMSYFACEVKKSLFWPKSYFERFIAKDFSRAASVFHEMKGIINPNKIIRLANNVVLYEFCGVI